MILSYGDRRTKRFALGGAPSSLNPFVARRRKRWTDWMRRPVYGMWQIFPVTDWKSLAVIVPATTASASTTNGESVSLGAKDHLDRST
jgi:hypothetical protein